MDKLPKKNVDNVIGSITKLRSESNLMEDG
jgi:hypothetical protein